MKFTGGSGRNKAKTNSSGLWCVVYLCLVRIFVAVPDTRGDEIHFPTKKKKKKKKQGGGLMSLRVSKWIPFGWT